VQLKCIIISCIQISSPGKQPKLEENELSKGTPSENNAHVVKEKETVVSPELFSKIVEQYSKTDSKFGNGKREDPFRTEVNKSS